MYIPCIKVITRMMIMMMMMMMMMMIIIIIIIIRIRMASFKMADRAETCSGS